MNVKTLEKIVSTPRLHNYLSSQGMQPKRAVSLYEQNIALSRSFYPLLSMLEVALRNALDRECIKHFSDPNWLVSQKTGFMADPRLTYTPLSGITKTNDFLRRSVDEAELKIKKQKIPISHGKIVAELTFGFWTELFEPTHYALLKGVPIHAFPNLPTNKKRKHLYTILGNVRRFRNRIYHNEPICFSKCVCDISEAVQIQRMIYEVLNWLSLDVPDWIKKIDDSDFELQITKRYSPSSRSIFWIFKEFKLKFMRAMRIFVR
jgi:hypothetical protein